MGAHTGSGKRLALGLARLLLVLPLALACGAMGESPAIQGITFGRSALAVHLSGAAPVRQVRVLEDGREVWSRNDLGETRQVIAELEWREGRMYTAEVSLSAVSTTLTTQCPGPSTASPLVQTQFDLEDVDPHQLWDYTYIGGIVRFSPDSRFVALGSEKGYLRLLDVASGQVVWRKRIGEGRIVSLDFSPDGLHLAVGEQSREAFLYLYDLDGQLLWKFNASLDVGTGDPGRGKNFLPAVDSLIFAPPSAGQSMVYLSVRRYQGPEAAAHRHMGKVYGLDGRSGQVVWAWPAEGCMDASPDCLHLDAAGRYLVFTNYWKGRTYNQSLYCLRAVEGSLLWNWDTEHPFPEQRLGIWHGVDISADGRLLAALTSDGRGLLMDHEELIRSGGQGGLLWERTICAPLDAGDLKVFAFPALARVSDRYVAFTTGNTKAWQGRKQPTIEHPSANSLFVYDLQGNLQVTAPIGGASYTESIHASRDGRFMVFPIRYNRSRKDAVTHGVHLFDHSAANGAGNRMVWFYHTEGMCLTADVSPDGKQVAVVEYPVDVDMRDEFEEIKGAHRLHLLR